MGAPWPPDRAKDDLGMSSAEMVYGAPLALPRDFIPPPPKVDPARHLRQLRDRVEALAPLRQPSMASSTTSLLSLSPSLRHRLSLCAETGRRSPYSHFTPVHTRFSCEGTKPSPSTKAARGRRSASTASSRPTRTQRPLSRWPSLQSKLPPRYLIRAKPFSHRGSR